MKSKAIFFCICFFAAAITHACDVCGSGAGGGYLGLVPGFKRKFISIRYLQNGLVSHLGPGGSQTYLTSNENFQTAELWGAFNLGRKFRVTAFIPYHFMEKTSSAGTFSKSGAGDVSMIGYYELLEKQRGSETRLFSQSLWVGTGIKLPTGRYNPASEPMAENSQNTFQLGTGSVDFSFHVMYDLRYQNAGINVNAGYRINTKNRYDYKYGNKLTTNLLAYYKLGNEKKLSICPNAGVLCEWSEKDEHGNQLEVWETGGYAVMGTVGLEISFGSIGFGTNFQTPVNQKLGEGKMVGKDRGMAYLSISF